MKLYILVVIGALINLGFGWNEGRKKPDYRFLIFFKQNIWATVFNMVLGAVLIYADETASWKEALLYGTAGQFLFKKITKIALDE